MDHHVRKTDGIKSSSCVQYDLVHIAAGDLLRAEIATGTDNGKCAKEYMEKGQLVPDEIAVTVGSFCDIFAFLMILP